MKKKILILIPSLEFGGGAERVVSTIATKLTKNYNISILTFFNFKNHYPFRGKYYSLKENVGKLRKILNFLKVYEFIRPISIYKYISSISPDLILSFMEPANFYSILTKIIFRIRIPLIISIRCNPIMQYRKITQRHQNFLIKKLYKLNSVDKIIVMSKDLENILVRDYKLNRSKFKIIYNGIDIDKINDLKLQQILAYKEIFNDESLVRFITLGRLSKGKGLEYLIEAFSKVKDKINNSKLIIIGNGPIKSKLETLIRKFALENDIHLLGLQKNPFKYLKKSDIFILSSEHEGFPNVLLEALACGLPIISTNCETGPKEILGRDQYGLLVNIKDSDDLSKKMLFLAKNPVLLEKYSKKSVQRANSFKIDNVIIDWIKLIESIVS